MRKAQALLLGFILTFCAGGASAARLGYAHASCLGRSIEAHDAISACTAVLQKFHTQAEVFIRRGAAFMELGAFDFAIGDFSRAIRLDPSAAAFELRALAYELQGQHAESLADYHMAQSLGSDDPTLAAAILRVTQALAPPPVNAPGREEPPPLPAPVPLAPEPPARAADGWLVAACLLLASAALAARFGRRRAETVAM